MSVVHLLLEEMDRMFDDVLPVEQPRKRRAVEASFACDLSEDKEKLVIEAEVPGVPKDKISITIEKDVLIIEATKEDQHGGDLSKKNHTKEIRHGRMRRSFKLPSDVQTETPRCSLSNGVLRIEMQRLSSSSIRKLEIL